MPIDLLSDEEQIRIITGNIEYLVSKYYELVHAYKDFIPGKSPVPVSGKVFDEKEMLSLTKAMLDFWLTDGETAKEFSHKLAKATGRRYAILCNSGSSANLLAITAMAEKGKNIITPAVGFPTTLNPIIQNGMIPVFVDVDLETYVPNQETIADAIEKYNGYMAVIPHTLGNPAIPQNSNYFPIIFDSCDALGGTYAGEKLTKFGDVSTLSFYPAHHITSLDYEEPIMVRNRNGEISIPKIGDFVDNQFFKNEGWECASFDKGGKIDFRLITDVVDHPINEPLYKVTTQTGRSSIVSKSHSVFTNIDGEIRPIPVSSLQIGDFIYVPNKLPNIETETTFVYKNYDKGSWNEFLDVIYITEDLARLLGLFVAEGSLFHSKKGNYNITFTFGPTEIQFAEEVRDTMKRTFGIKSRIYYKKSTIIVRASNKALYNFLLSNCGTGSLNKHIPNFLFSSQTAVKQSFVKAYFEGDGTEHETYGTHKGFSFDSKTVSKQLAIELFYLLLQTGINPRFSVEEPKQRNFGSYISDCKESYSICYSSKSIINAKGFRGDKKKKRKIGHLSLVKITNIEKTKPTTNRVFDLSVEGYENFAGGIGFILHNTGEGGAVLVDDPRLKLKIESLRDWGRDCWCTTGHDNTCNKRFSHQFENLPFGYDHKYVYSQIGYNLKMTDLQAAIGIPQLDKLPKFIDARKENFGYLRDSFIHNRWDKHLYLPKPSSDLADPSWFGFPLTIREDAPFDRLSLLRYLDEKKVGTRLLFGGNLLKQPAYKGIDYVVHGTLHNSDLITTNSFWVGVYPGLTKPMLDYVLECFEDFLKEF